MSKTMTLNVVTPEHPTLQTREVEQVVLPGVDGSFGVLPGHMSLVAALRPGLLKITSAGQEKLYAIGGGYAQITPAAVVVLADTAEPAEDIDVEAAKLAQERAREQLKRGLQGPQLEAAEISLRKALAGLKVAEFMRRRKDSRT